MKTTKAFREWRNKVRKGGIMEPETFDKIAESASRKYGSKEIGKRVAGAAYWKTAKAKYRRKKNG